MLQRKPGSDGLLLLPALLDHGVALLLSNGW